MQIGNPSAGPTSEPSLYLNEIFYSIQGEGPFAGMPRIFIRFGGCNLSCSWCDTPYTWDWTGQNGKRYFPREEVKAWSIPEIVRHVSNIVPTSASPGAVFTGGEPLLQNHERLLKLRYALRVLAAEFETNGTVMPSESLLPTEAWTPFRFVVSPKLSNSGMPFEKRINQHVLREMNRIQSRVTGESVTHFKFVCQDALDVEEALDIVRSIGVSRGRVWIMPEGTSAEAVLETIRRLERPCKRFGMNLTPRLHVLLYGNTRGT